MVRESLEDPWPGIEPITALGANNMMPLAVQPLCKDLSVHADTLCDLIPVFLLVWNYEHDFLDEIAVNNSSSNCSAAERGE
jgi:hypothetical protein